MTSVWQLISIGSLLAIVVICIFSRNKKRKIIDGKSDNTGATKFLTLVILIEVALLVCACRGTSVPSFYYNESYYHICGSGESPILKECGLPLEITSDLAGTFISYLEPGPDNSYLFTETDTGTILYEYGPDPNENVYIVLLDRRYFAAIRYDAEGHHGLQTENE